jgi:hypothetical protein
VLLAEEIDPGKLNTTVNALVASPYEWVRHNLAVEQLPGKIVMPSRAASESQRDRKRKNADAQAQFR